MENKRLGGESMWQLEEEGNMIKLNDLQFERGQVV